MTVGNIRDLFYFEGILDGAMSVYHARTMGHTFRYYDRDRVYAFLDRVSVGITSSDGLDWSDPHYTAQSLGR